MNPEEVVDLGNFTEFEKAKIFQVLKRNNHVARREERRLWQLAVREQIEGMTGQQAMRHETKLKTRTGEWHKDLVRRRGKSTDVPNTLYRSISLSIMGDSPSRTIRRSPSIQSLPQVEPAKHKQLRKTYSDVNHNQIGIDMTTMKAWVESQEKVKSDVSVEQFNKSDVTNADVDKLNDNNIPLKFDKEEVIQRNI